VKPRAPSICSRPSPSSPVHHRVALWSWKARSGMPWVEKCKIFDSWSQMTRSLSGVCLCFASMVQYAVQSPKGLLIFPALAVRSISTLDDIGSLLQEWRQIREKRTTPSVRPSSARASTRPSSAHSKGHGGKSFSRPELTPSSAHTYSLDLDGMQTTPRSREFSSRLSLGASTLADGVGMWRAMRKASEFAGVAASHRARSGFFLRTPRDATLKSGYSPRIGTPSTVENDDVSNRYDFVNFDASPGNRVMRVSVRPMSARTRREPAAVALQRPSSARMSSSRDARTENSGAIGQTASDHPSPHLHREKTHIVREFEPLRVQKMDVANAEDSRFSPLRIVKTPNAIYDEVNFDDHLRWLNAATCGELVDAICRRPHDEMLQYARRLQDHLQIFGIVNHTFTSRDELERQHSMIQGLHE
jgi:hypothetical protein